MMNRYFKHIILSLISVYSLAQQKLEGQYFYKDGNLYIRWAPVNEANWTEYCKGGFDVYRISWNSDALPDSNLFTAGEKINSDLIKALPENDAAWQNLIKEYEETTLIKNVLFKKPSANVSKSAKEYVHGLCMLSADFYAPLAKAMGLYFNTSVHSGNGKSAYMIKSKGKLKSTPYIFILDPSKEMKLASIASLNIKNKRKQIKLGWEIKSLASSYSGYYIERSDNGNEYVRLNKKPHIVLKTETDKNKSELTFIDSTSKPDILYKYRICGISFFGFNGEYSNLVSVKATEPIEDGVQPDSIKYTSSETFKIYGHLPMNSNISKLSKIVLYRSVNDSGVYIPVQTSSPVTANIVMEDKPVNNSNYYRFCLYNPSGDSLFTASMLGVVPDVKPPSSPTGLTGKIDSTGKVYISWNSNTEKDFKAYRVFRCNSLKEEFVDVNNQFIATNSFTDSVSMNTLSEEVYYSVIAVDQAYNKSNYSEPLKLKRPDKIKPQESICKSIYHNDSAVIMLWIPSMSNDISKYILYRKVEAGALEKIKEFNANDSLNYIDTQVQYDKYHQYLMVAIDDDGNSSESYSPNHYFSSRIRKAISNISYSIDKEKRSITLNWAYNEKGIENFIIYKAKKGETYRIYKTVKGSVLSLEDKELYIGNIYTYKIKAIYLSGAESKISKEVEIEF